MAADHELKEMLRGLAASEEEMEIYRDSLAERLEAEGSRRRIRARAALLAAATAALVVGSLVLLRAPAPRFDQETLAEVQGLVASSEGTEALAVAAARAERPGRGLAPHNGRMVRVLTLSPQLAVSEAVEGAVADPRAEFRAFYLEWLLDRSDGAVIDPDRVGELLDRETDPLCLELWGELLDVALRTSGRRDLPAVV